MSDEKEEVYGPERAQRLVAMLRALAERIQALDRAGQLLERGLELQKLIGNVRSELFHYEVRLTYDTPDIAESRRVVGEPQRRAPADAGEPPAAHRHRQGALAPSRCSPSYPSGLALRRARRAVRRRAGKVLGDARPAVQQSPVGPNRQESAIAVSRPRESRRRRPR